MLYGMAAELKQAANEMGFRVREYVPVGEMIPGMAYLVRRLLENTSNESWLRRVHGQRRRLDARRRPTSSATDPGVDGSRCASNMHALSDHDPRRRRPPLLHRTDAGLRVPGSGRRCPRHRRCGGADGGERRDQADATARSTGPMPPSTGGTPRPERAAVLVRAAGSCSGVGRSGSSFVRAASPGRGGRRRLRSHRLLRVLRRESIGLFDPVDWGVHRRDRRDATTSWRRW